MSQRPNVLVIMTDQHRHDLMTCAGRNDVPTPNLDRIAQRGVRFRNAVCSSPVCLASRSSMLTGLHAHHTRAISNRDRLDWRFRTMAHHFNAHGYHSALIGKMHFNDAHNHGFEYYLSINDWLMYLGPEVQIYADEVGNHPLNDFLYTMQVSGDGFPDVELWEERNPWIGKVHAFDWQRERYMSSRMPAEDHLDMFIARESAKFLAAQRDQEQPFFLISSFMKPHSPFFAPSIYAERYPIDDMVLPPVGNIDGYPEHIQARIRALEDKDQRRLQAHRAGYRAGLAFVDDCIGHLYSALEGQGLLENTIVVYTSDHGEMDGDHGLYQKFCCFDGAMRVPMIVSHPGHLPEGAVSDALCELLGLYPTLAELSDTPLAAGTTIADLPGAPVRLDGRSFAASARDPAAAGPEDMYCEYFPKRDSEGQHALRTRSWKYVFNRGSTHELYDLGQDPGEFVNRIDDPALAALGRELHERLRAHFDVDDAIPVAD